MRMLLFSIVLLAHGCMRVSLAAEGGSTCHRQGKTCQSSSQPTFGQAFLQRGTMIEGAGLDTSSLVNATPQELMPCASGAIATTPCMTLEQYDTLSSSVQALLHSLPEACTASNCPRADWAGCVLRMAGHDFMDFADGQGGSDACTDMADPDNGGLSACLHSGEHGVALLQAYQPLCSTVSLADFLVISAEAVIGSTRARHQGAVAGAVGLDLRSQFRFGRTTSSSCEFAQGRLPNPEEGCAAVETTFLQRMGLDWTEAAALMGVHTLGRAQVSNSGYHGWWSDPENSQRFNNDYYVSLLAKGWVPELAVAGNPGKNQWERSDIGRDTSADGHEMMLNTDLCLAFSENAGRNSGPVVATQHNSCAWLEMSAIPGAVQNNGGEYCGGGVPRGGAAQRGQCCGDQDANDCGNRQNPTGPAAQAILTFASDEGAWLDAFQRAWRIATENGFQGLQQLQAQCQTSSTAAPSSTPLPAASTLPPASTTEETIHSTSQLPQDFIAVDGGIDRACRGANVHDNQAGYFTISIASSRQHCQALCRAEQSCQGIEFNSVSGRCEIWTRAEGILATAEVPGFVCFRYTMAPASTTSSSVPQDFVAMDGGANKACRGANTQDNQASYFRVAGVRSLEHCQELCRAEQACQGIEYSVGRCEIWTRAEGILATADVPGFLCFRYVGAQTSLSTTAITTSSEPTTRPSTGGSNGGGSRRRPGGGRQRLGGDGRR